ncbi:MAG: hypothetical protein VSS75_008470 [Candidatus Parabeggiatoa sp.]|nr:hypothetical protein [Candidatus Parabeggiatoa sp.]
MSKNVFNLIGKRYNYKDCLFDADKCRAFDELISFTLIHLLMKVNDIKLGTI